MLCTVITVRRPRPARIVQIRGRETRLPVVAMHDVGNEVASRPGPDVGAGAAQGGKAERVVGEVLAAAVGIRSAVAIVQMRGVENEHVEAAHGRRAQARRTPEQRRVLVHDRCLRELRHHGAIAGDQRSHRDSLAPQRGRQRTGDVGEPARLHEREDFRGDRQNADRATTQPVEHRLRDEADAALGPSKARGVELRVFAHDEPGRNPHAGVDDHVAQLAASSDVHVRQQHAVVDVGPRVHVNVLAQQRIV